MDEIRDIEIENIEDKEINVNKDEEEFKDLLKEREVQDNIKDIKQGYPQAINRRHHNTISEKWETLEYLKKGNSIHKIEEKYAIDRKTIKYWIEHEKYYLNNSNPCQKNPTSRKKASFIINGRRAKYMSLDRW